jgi:hypothetical protein
VINAVTIPKNDITPPILEKPSNIVSGVKVNILTFSALLNVIAIVL